MASPGVYWRMFATSDPIVLVPRQRAELEAMTRSTRIWAELARRARLILALDAGLFLRSDHGQWGASATTISRWRQRFQERGATGLLDAPQSSRPNRLSAAKEAQILRLTKKRPPSPTRTGRSGAWRSGPAVSPSTVQRVRAQEGTEAPPARSLHGESRPGLREESGRHPGAVPDPPRERYGGLYG